MPVIVRKRESQTVDIPVSEVKIASAAAWRSTAAASASGRMRRSGLSSFERTRLTIPLRSKAGSVSSCWRARQAA